MRDSDEILDDFSYEQGGFNKDEKIIVAKTFIDPSRARFAASYLTSVGLKNFLANGDATMFAQNVMDGIRLFVRESDKEKVSRALEEWEEIQMGNEDPHMPREQWYEDYKVEKTSNSMKKISLIAVGILALFFLVRILFSLFNGFPGN